MHAPRFKTLADCFKDNGNIMVTAHGTYIGRYPENSLIGIEAAVALGCDCVEFDLRTTADNVVVLHHDKTIERSSDGSGAVAEMSYEELRKFNYSYYEYFVDCSGRKGKKPAVPYCPITRFDEMLEQFGKKILMNIQIYGQDRNGLENICGIFKDFDLYDYAYCTLNTFEDGALLRSIDPDIQLCILERPEEHSKTTIALLHDFHDFGSTFAQPRWFDITPEYCEASRRLNICSNVYYANYERDARHFIGCGIHGILSDYPEVIIPLARK